MLKWMTLLAVLGNSFIGAAEKEGIERLMRGNQRYVHDVLKYPNRTPERRWAVFATQEPFAIIVGCSDSRVSPEILFDQGVGDLFVVRLAGNVIGPEALDSIKYAANHLHSSVVLILGHENCGAVQVVAQGNAEGIPNVAKHIKHSIRKEGLEASIKENALQTKAFLLTHPSIQELVEKKQLEVYAGYYHLKTGAVELLDN